ncbi:hypothetical protein N752_30000 [Desulforamulus aquiferis]|nr:accessory gene regulator B family protein [Desulforamulus aquiferis]RYD01536.1 hypothetical protein N752_30000 [Desulforamulus aquiferis]
MKTFAKIIAKWLTTEDSKNRDVAVIAYGLEILLNIGFQVLILVMVGLLLDITQTILAAVIPTIIYRTLSGGSHFSTFWSCTVVSTLIFTFIGYMTKDSNSNIFLLMAVYILIIIITYLWAPYNPNRFFDNIKKQKLKKASMIYLIFVMFSSIGLNISHPLVDACMVGLVWQSAIITPWGANVIKFLDHILNIRKEENLNVN